MSKSILPSSFPLNTEHSQSIIAIISGTLWGDADLCRFWYQQVSDNLYLQTKPQVVKVLTLSIPSIKHPNII